MIFEAPSAVCIMRLNTLVVGAIVLGLMAGAAAAASPAQSLFDESWSPSDRAEPLSTGGGRTPKQASLLVKLTRVETEPQYTRLGASLDSASRTAIAGIPGVTVLSDDVDEEVMAKRSRNPVVILSARLQRLAMTKQGGEIEFKAQAQYIIFRIPGRDIAAIVDGAARARVAAAQVRTKATRQQVEDEVAAAAIESAARRAPAALSAVAKR